MRLSHQLTLLIVVLFVLIMIGTVYISINSNRDFLLDEMQTQTQDSTTTLAKSLQPIMAQNDIALASAMVDAVFDRGYYQRIEILDMDDKPLVNRQIPVLIEGVPAWFVRFIEINGPEGKEVIDDRWKQLAKLKVVAHPGIAYRELWQISVSNFVWLVGLGVMALLVIMAIIQIVMRPLHAVERQARAIAQQDFSVRPKLPRTPELRELVMVMNGMADKLEQFLRLQTKQVNELREQVYSDAVTGLMNRAAFENHIDFLLREDNEFQQGNLLLIRTEGLQEVNQQQGYQQGNQALQGFANKLQTLKQFPWEVARISGQDFVVLMPGDDDATLETHCRMFYEQIKNVNGKLRCCVAAVHFQSPDDRHAILSLADTALSHAMQNGQGWHVVSAKQQNDLPRLTATQWREKLLTDIETDRLVLFQQPVFDSSSNEIQREVLLRIDHQGRFLPTATVMSLAGRHRFSERVDRYVLEKVASHMTSESPVYAINVTAETLLDTSFPAWLAAMLERKRIKRQSLVLEVNEAGLHRYASELPLALQALSQQQIHFAFDGVAGGEIAFTKLRGAIPAYIKLDGRYCISIEHNQDHRQLLEKIISLAQALSIPVIAQHVENETIEQTLFAMGVAGVQGYHMGKPVALE